VAEKGSAPPNTARPPPQAVSGARSGNAVDLAWARAARVGPAISPWLYRYQRQLSLTDGLAPIACGAKTAMRGRSSSSAPCFTPDSVPSDALAASLERFGWRSAVRGARGTSLDQCAAAMTWIFSKPRFIAHALKAVPKAGAVCRRRYVVPQMPDRIAALCAEGCDFRHLQLAGRCHE